MANQPRPAWFRLSAIASRPVAPAPTTTQAPAPTPAPPPVAPFPTVTRPMGLPFTTTPPAPATTAPPTPPRSPIVTPAPVAPPPESLANPLGSTAGTPPRSPIVTTAPDPAPTRSSIATSTQVTNVPDSPVKPSETAPPPPSSPARITAPPRSPVPPPPAPQPSPQMVLASTLSPQIPAPSPKQTLTQSTSPVQQKPATTSTNAPLLPSPKIETRSPFSTMQASLDPSPGAKGATLVETGNLKATTTTPASSPLVVKPSEITPKQSPTIKPLSNPPSPFTLPPVQAAEDESDAKIPAEVEQKTVLVQETIDKPMEIPNNSHSNTNKKKDYVTKANGTAKKNTDSEETGKSVITLAGENKGASMELGSSQKKNYSIGKPQSSENNSNGEEGHSARKNKTSKAVAAQSPPTTVFLNSNVQGVNNSILYNCNYRHNDPGVHLSLTKKVTGNHPKDLPG